MPEMGRPKDNQNLDKQVNILVSPTMYDQLQVVNRGNMSWFIREAIQEKLDKEG